MMVTMLKRDENQISNSSVYQYTIKTSLYIFLGSTFLNIGNYILWLLVGRIASPEDFSSIAAATAIISLISVPSSALGWFFTQTIAGLRGEKSSTNAEDTAASLRSSLLKICVAIAFLYCLATPLITRITGIDLEFLLTLTPTIALIPFIAGTNGILHGFERFKSSSFVTILEATIKITSLGLLISFLSPTHAITIALNVTSITIALALNHLTSQDRKKQPVIWRGLYPFLLSSIGLAFMGSMDILAAKTFLSAYDAGSYAALSMLSKIIIFGSPIIGGSLLPLAARWRDNNKQAVRAVFSLSVFSTLSIAILVSLVFTLFSHQVLTLSFGTTYTSVSSLLIYFCLTATVWIIAQLISRYFLATEARILPYFIWPTLALQLLLLWQFHSSIVHIQLSTLLAYTALLGLLTVRYVITPKTSA